MKFPIATLLLTLAVAGAYFYLSGGLLYLDQPTIDSLALNSAKSPFGFVSYMFIHVGVAHLAGNLLPLVIFSLILEASLPLLDVLMVFLGAGIVSSTLFSFLNPSVALVGASAAVSGLIGAAVAARPKLALAALMASPLIFAFVLLPIVQALSFQQQASVFGQANELGRQLEEMSYLNNAGGAAAVKEKLAVAAKKKRVLEEGAQREASTPADFFVHIVGVAFGVAYVFFLRRKLFITGAEDFARFLRSLPFVGERKPANKVKKYGRKGARLRPTKA